MYITHDNQTYANVRVYSTSGSVRFTGESLSGVSELTGAITVFADNGFAMQSFAPGDFLRQEIQDGNWLLTNVPLPTPQPVVATPVAYDLNTSTAFAVKLLMSEKKPETADEIISLRRRCSIRLRNLSHSSRAGDSLSSGFRTKRRQTNLSSRQITPSRFGI